VQEKLRVAVEAISQKETLLQAVEKKCSDSEVEMEELRRSLSRETTSAVEARRAAAQAATGFEAATWALNALAPKFPPCVGSSLSSCTTWVV
jgi:hypothetical protein